MDTHQEEVLENRHMEDEINLWELIQIIWRYKWLIIILFIVAVSTSIIVSKMMIPVYELSAAIKIAKTEVISSKELATVLMENFKRKIINSASKNFLLKKPRINKLRGENSDLITFRFQTTQCEKVVETLKKEVEKIARDESKAVFIVKYKYILKAIEEQISGKNVEISIIDKEILKSKKRLNTLEDKYNILKDCGKSLQKATKEGMLPGLILIQNEISKLKENLYNQKIKLQDDRKDLKLLVLKKEEILNQGKNLFIWALNPKCFEKPVKPRPFLYMVISGILALIVGVFLAFIIEFVRKNLTR